ncbi:MAG: hypothetical protein ABS87_00940 [Sphingomonas sp. SCN 67-18]|nr:DnaB-like helicase C-terminal domain-containing protein [Sphingomonas sp. SCN 67-18]ODU22764.1 MAG: hypothetical protein ABS87_00940 [Sphingomonas sp. SCN 67-18]
MIHTLPTPEVFQNIEAEAALLGKMLTENRCIDRIADKLRPEDFAEPIIGKIYGLIVREHSMGRPVNPFTLKPYLEGDQAFESLGGMSFFAGLTGAQSLMVDERAADQIADFAARRRLIAGLQSTVELAGDREETTEAIINAADAAIVEATQHGETLHQPTGAQCLDELLASFDEPILGVECKIIPPIDKLLGPLRPKQLVICAARPGMGKTAVAISYALGAVQAGYGVLFISLEMSSTELGARMASDLCFDGQRGIPFEAIRDAKLKPDQIRKVVQARDMLASSHLQIVDAGKLTIGRIGMIVRRHKRRMAARGVSLDLVIVDYLQLVHPDQRTRSNYEAVSEVSRGLKAVAKDHGVAVMALAQLSRDVEKRPDRKPQLSDLRDSGQIEQDADAVMFLLREEYYHRLDEPDNDSPKYREWAEILERCQGGIEFIVAKRRNGRTGSATGRFYGAYQAVRGID